MRELILEIRFEKHDLPLPLTMWQTYWTCMTRGSSTPARTISDFDMKLAFFVVMGGYALDIAPEDTRILPVPLSTRDSLELYRSGMIKDEYLDIKQIKDKAKDDGLAKFLVYMQALVSNTEYPLQSSITLHQTLS